ncbi:MAG TPA: sugar ABC transporter ATP-binding protein [Candidatus Limnocylindria bacterium]|nr:sugar ABC transporter ATP-binding protein [Candidatus Limnocylindria bacterium]
MVGNGLDLRVEAISKSFGETRALSEVSLSVRPASVHALVGENGAGKSTLGRIIAGIIRPDAGRIYIDGEPVELNWPRDALDRGIAAIAQEIALVPSLTAAENVLLGVEPCRLGFVRRRTMAQRYRELAASVGFEVPADRPVGSLSIAQQQEVEILRALSRNARLVVMDEPSARLSAAETDKLHRLIRALAEGGRSVLLISHFLNEVLAVADTVSVLRDGRAVHEAPTATQTEASLVEKMLGRKLGAQFPARRPAPPSAPVVLRAADLSGPGFDGVSLAVRAGEIVGLAGLVGAGRTEVGRAIVGAAPVHAGTLEIDGAERRFKTPRDGRRRGVLMIPESRREQGLFHLRSARENVSVASLEQLSRLGFVESRRERTVTDDVIERVDVRAPADAPASALSGGNQQKLLFARTMLVGPRLLVADEPTRGVDVGAKRAIYDLLVGLAADGMAILLISSELEEILGLAHRVLVMRSGRLVAELSRDEMSEQRILAAAFRAPSEQRGAA